jgi:hypothetical protein
VSCGQAGGYVLEKRFPIPSQYVTHGRHSVFASIFFLSIWFGYKLTHLLTWDPLEFVVLGIVQCVVLAVTVFVLFHL